MLMTTIALDTHRAIRRLEAHGFTAEQAEGIVETLADSEFVTNGFLRETIASLKADIYRAMLIQTGAIAAILFGILQFTGT